MWNNLRQRASKVAALSLYWRVLISPNRWRVFTLLSLGLAGSLMEATVLGMTVPILDLVAHPEQIANNKAAQITSKFLATFRYSTDASRILFTLIIISSLLFLLRGILVVAQEYWSATIVLWIKQDTRAMLFAKALRTPFEILTCQSRGAIINDIMQPSDAMGVSTKSLGVLLSGFITVGVLLGLMLYLSKMGTALIFAFALIGLVGWRGLLKRLSAARGHLIFDIQRSQSKIEVDSIDGIRAVKTSVIEDELSSQHRATLQSEIAPTQEITLFRNGPMVVNEAIACVMIFTLGAFTFIWPRGGLTFSSLVAMLLALRRMSPVISSMNAASVELGKWRRGLEVLEEAIQRPSEAFGSESIEIANAIEFRHLTFRYATKSTDAIQNVSLTFKKGTVTALVGPTGSGKSTIANLILGLYTPDQDGLLINGVPLKQLDLQAWRKKIGYVSQDVFLFNATILENIRLWHSDISLDQVREAARVAQLDEYIQSLPAGYDTVVGDRGLRLSGGQCQRVAIARAVLRRPEVLILDEATSALDNLTEKAVYQAIESFRKQSIVLVIAHRLSTVRNADQIAVIKAGQIAEVGVHDDLLAAKGVYASLYGNEMEVAQN